MNIALCTDDNYVIPALVCITSVFENNKDAQCTVYILTRSLNEYSERKFQQLAELYNQTIKIVHIDESPLKKLNGRGRYAKATYYRFLLPSILLKEDRILYLDCDIINTTSLRLLYETPLEGHSCAVVVDQNHEDIITLNRTKVRGDYFNAGVILMNLQYWRDNKVMNRLIDIAVDHPEMCLWNDQDALNIVLDGTVVYLDYRYNYQEFWFTHRNRTSISRSKWPALDESQKNVVLIHYCADIKPWFKECGHPMKEEFTRYATMHGFIGYKSRKYYNLKYRIVSSLIRRLQRIQSSIKH